MDALVLTHPDADHIGGAPAVLEAFEVGLVVDPGFPAGKGLFLEVVRAARRREARWVAARAGRELRFGEVVVCFLYPEEISVDAGVEANDVSVAFTLEFGRFRALFLGDAPAAVEERLVARHGAALRADLLKVAHHGSSTSTAEALLLAATPRWALIPVGRDNRYGHPSAEVLARLERHGARILRTDRNGAVTLRVRPDGRTEVHATR